MSKEIMKAKIAVVLLALFTVVWITDCVNTKLVTPENSKIPYANIENIDVENYYVKGKNQQKFYKIPKRVVAVGDNVVETLMELGIQDNIVLAVAGNKWNFQFREENQRKFQTVPQGDYKNLNKETIVSLNPDLIIGQQMTFSKEYLGSTKYWNDRGVNTIVTLNANAPNLHVHPETIENEMKCISDYGKIFGKEDEAAEINKEIIATIEKVKRNAIHYPKPKVMIIEFMRYFVSYDNTKLVGNMAERLGGYVEESPPVITSEELLKIDPDVLFVVCSHSVFDHCYNRIYDDPAFNSLKCVKNHRIYGIPMKFTYSTLCRTNDGLKMLAKGMYPGIQGLDDEI